MRSLIARWAALCAACLLQFCLQATPARSQEFPSREIKIVIGNPAGTGVDIIARYIGNKLSILIGKPVIIENKPGALANLAAESVARSRPDGYTLFITPGNSTMASNIHLFKKLPFDPLNDFTPITTLVKIHFTFGVAPASTINSMRELIDHLKVKGDKATYGTSGPFQVISGNLFKTVTGTTALAVPYRGTPEIHRDVNAGLLDFIIADASYTLAPAKAGNLKLLTVASAKRSVVAPELPGMLEAGVSNFDMSSWFGAWLPANTPSPIVAKLVEWFNTIIVQEDTKNFLLLVGAEPFPGTSESLREFTKSEIEKWGKLIRDAKIEPQ
jgi:tripartite-type tricarboxylate transporter receptor subunit TctC